MWMWICRRLCKLVQLDMLDLRYGDNILPFRIAIWVASFRELALIWLGPRIDHLSAQHAYIALLLALGRALAFDRYQFA